MSTLKATNIQHASAADPAIVLATNGSATANLSSINSGQLAGMRNKIINGAMEISQRGTSFAAVADGIYTIDRFLWGRNGAMVVTITQSTDVPNDTFQSSYKVDVTTADASIAAGEYAIIVQRIEGYNLRDLIGQTFTLSFWVKSPKTGTHCVSFRNSGGNRSYVLEYTVSAANTWEYKTLTVTGGLITAGTWNWTNGIGLNVFFTLATGSTFQTTAGAWQTGNFIGTSSQVNCMDSTANDFFLTGVQLEIGPVATPFERRPIGTEFALCQRYFQQFEFKNYGYGLSAMGHQSICAFMPWATHFRAAPTGTLSSLTLTNLNAGTVAIDAIFNSGFLMRGTPSGSSGYTVSGLISADAEL